MDNFEKQIDEVLNFDAIDTAEKVGEALQMPKEDVEKFSLFLFMKNNEEKRKLLSENIDTHFGITTDEYITILKEMSFEEVLHEKFTNTDTKYEDEYFIFFNKKLGLLLEFDTYWGHQTINSSRFYYNWKSNTKQYLHGSGHWIKDNIFIGYNDAREGLRLQIKQMQEQGEFLKIWKETDRLFRLCHYIDSNKGSEQRIWAAYTAKKTQERLEKLPIEVLKTIFNCDII